MRLSGKILKNVVDVNHFQQANQAYIAEGQPNDIYIQLIDLDWSTKATPEQSPAFVQYPIRYISQASSISVKAKFLNIDDDQEFEITATQPFADDKSIFKFALTSSQTPSAGNMIVTVTEDGVDKSFVITQAIQVDLLNKGSC